jgi:hypothetical protein
VAQLRSMSESNTRPMAPAGPGRATRGTGGRAPVRLAWAALALSLGLLVLSRVLSWLPTDPTGDDHDSSESVATVAVVVLALVGAMITIRRPQNRIGWIVSASVLLWAVGGAADAYAAHGLRSPQVSLPAEQVMAWLGSWTWAPPLGVLVTFLFLLFPDGQLPSRRWRPVAWLAAAATAGVTIAYAFGQRPLEGYPELPNPLGIPGATAFEVAFLLLPPVSLAAAVSLLLRFRDATGEARQQLKWFTAGAAVAALSVLASVLIGIAGSDQVANAVVLGGIVCLPVATGVAILRYRLYDIDRLINRTLVYGLLTAALGLGYAAGSLVFVLVAGAGSDPPSWLVAAATLAAAGLFQPARRRIQQLVDRRFNRHRYDAAKTIQAFSTRLRSEIDLDTLSAELCAVANQTMEPRSVSLWLRPVSPSPPRAPERMSGV